MDKQYKSEVAKMVAYGMNWIAKEEFELPLREHKGRTGKLSKVQTLQVLGRDAKGLVSGSHPLMFSTPPVTPIKKRF